MFGYGFPGNVRELENIIERASTLCEDGVIGLHDLKLNLGGSSDSIDIHGDSRNESVDSLDDHLEEIEKDILMDALEKTRWNKTEAAKKLGISFRSIRYRLKKLGLDDE